MGDDGQELGLRTVELLEVGVSAPLRFERFGQLVLSLANPGHVLDHQQHVLGFPALVRDRGRRHLQPQPTPAACRRPHLHAAAIAQTGKERGEARPTGCEVIGAQQLGPGLCAQRLEVVLEHLQQRGVGLKQVAFCADAGDPDGRVLEDRPMVGLAALQGLGRLGAPDELTDLRADSGQHGHDRVVDSLRMPGEECDHAIDVATGDHGERDSLGEACMPGGRAEGRLRLR